MKKLQPTVFFVDRCLGKGKIVEALRRLDIAIEVHDDHFDNNAQDVDWLPEIGKRGWVVLTKDTSISKNYLERIAVARAQVKMFMLASQSLPGTEMTEIFIKAVNRMQQFNRKYPAPFIAKIYRDATIQMWKDSQTLLEELKEFLEDLV